MIAQVLINNECLKLAEEYQRRIYNNKIDDINNYTGLNIHNRWYIGFIGEWAVNHLFTSLGIDTNWEPLANGISDRYDMFIAGLKVDVKTAGSENYKYLMIPYEQFKKTNIDLYIGVKLDFDNMIAEIWGYVTKIELLNVPVKDFGKGVLTVAYKLSDLHEFRFGKEELIK